MLSGNSKDQENQPKKSEVSLVYELALKRNLHVHFEKDWVCFFLSIYFDYSEICSFLNFLKSWNSGEKVTEEGPPHLKHYCIKLSVGKQQEGEGDDEKDKKGDKP